MGLDFIEETEGRGGEPEAEGDIVVFCNGSAGFKVGFIRMEEDELKGGGSVGAV